jgi:predicted transcriptional regulator
MSEDNSANVGREELLKMTAKVAASYFGNNSVPAAQISDIITSVHNSLASIDGQAEASRGPAQKPAVPIRRSVTPDFVICLEDGKKLKMLKRHLRTTYNLTPEEYRAPTIRWSRRTMPSSARILPRRSASAASQKRRPRQR